MSDRPFDPAHVRQLAEILVETGLTEIEIDGKDGRIRVVRAHPPAATMTVASPAPMAAAPLVASAPLAQSATAAAAAQEADDARHPGAILSPMVGVAYLSPDPSSPPFVTIGQSVTAGQTLLLIEAMKTFNQIRAAKAGTVTRILIASGSPVEFGEPMMIVE